MFRVFVLIKTDTKIYVYTRKCQQGNIEIYGKKCTKPIKNVLSTELVI